METIIKEYTIFDLSELSPEAQEKAHQRYIENITEYFWINEAVDSLKALFDHCKGVSLVDYRLGERSWIELSWSMEGDPVDISGKRAIAWLENNLLDGLRIPYKGKKRWELARYGKDYRAGMIKPCPFTGYCFDDDLLSHLINKIKSGNDLESAFGFLADKFEEMYNAEVEYQESLEYFKEFCESNDIKFLKNGEVFY